MFHRDELLSGVLQTPVQQRIQQPYLHSTDEIHAAIFHVEVLGEVFHAAEGGAGGDDFGVAVDDLGVELRQSNNNH